MSRGERIAAGSIAIGCLVLAMKCGAWWITGSAALCSDALESIVNVAAAAIALAALHFAAIPPTPIIPTVMTRRNSLRR